jgi:hypothetical protein
MPVPKVPSAPNAKRQWAMETVEQFVEHHPYCETPHIRPTELPDQAHTSLTLFVAAPTRDPAKCWTSKVD